jgi:transposase
MIGCDLHEKTMLLKAAVGREEPVRRTFRNTTAGRRAMIGWLEAWAQEAGGARVVLAYEASCLGFGLYDEVTEAGFECFVLAPTRIERSPKHVRSKTDERDAQRLLDLVRAHLLAGTPLPAVWVPVVLYAAVAPMPQLLIARLTIIQLAPAEESISPAKT